MQSYVVTVTGSWNRRYLWLHIASTQASGQYRKPHLGHPDTGLPHLCSLVSQGYPLTNPGTNPGHWPPTIPRPTNLCQPPKMEEVGLAASHSPVSLALPGQC